MAEPEETEASNLELVRTHYAAFSARDVDRILAGLDPSVEIVIHDEHGGAVGEAIRGHEGARAFFEGINVAVAHSTVEINEIRADGDRVLATIGIGGTIRSSGVTGILPAVHLFTCRDGLITSIHTHRPEWRQHDTPPRTGP